MILVFDSGVGGLSVLDSIRAALPGLGVVYAADNAGFPYGVKTEAEIAARVPALLGRMVERYRPDLVVIACNTASTIALAHTRAALGVPVVGTVPAIKPAALATRTGVIGVLGTEATVRQPYVDRLAAEFAQGMTVLRQGAPALVEAAEAQAQGLPRAGRCGFAGAGRAVAAARRSADGYGRARLHALPAASSRACRRGPGARFRRQRRRHRAPCRNAARANGKRG